MPNQPYARRRERFLAAIGDAVAILPAAPERVRSNDVAYPYRQDSDLLYLTGFPEPDAVAVLRPGHETPFTLFVRPKDPKAETWDGRRSGMEGAVSDYGADAAHPIDALHDALPELLRGHDTLVHRAGIRPALDAELQKVLDRLRARNRDGVQVPRAVVDSGSILHEHRLRKDPEELEILRRAARLSAEGHRAAMRVCRPGLREADVQAALEYVFRRGGAQACGYPSIVAGGANACILHYTDNDAVLEDGTLLLIDAGGELDGYSADITRTFPVNGRFDATQRALYEVVLEAQERAIAACAPGVPFDAVHEAAVRSLTEGLVRLGLLEGEVDALVDDGAYRRYYLHRTSHWLGLDVHDVGSYFRAEGESRLLEPGMVLTVEPGLYVAPDAEDAPDRFRGIGIRIEDDVAITEEGHEVLSRDVPKDPDAIERLMAEPAELPS